MGVVYLKILSFFIIAVLIISLAGCTALPGSGKAREGKSETLRNSGSRDDKSGGKSDVKPEGLDWTINVDDTISGSYQLPTGGKDLKYDITLRLVAWKSGGEDVYGRYEGEAYILFKFDESGLSDADLLYMGGGAFNRKCEKLEFEVEAYDQEKLNSKTVPLMDNAPIAPLYKFNAMASFMSVWSTTLQMDQTVIGRKSGDTLSAIKEGPGEASSDNMGIDLLIANKTVIVEIPTYRLTWNCGFFTGNVDSSPLGTAERVKLSLPDELIEDPDEAGGGDKEGSAQTGQNGENEEDPFDLPQNEFQGSFIDNDPNGLSGFDVNGDGKVDMYIDENGKVKFDINLDGVFDDLDDAEVEWGQG